MPVTAATAPHSSRSPSMIEASISTVPSTVRTEPRPALKRGWSSRDRTALSTASRAEPPLASTCQPACAAARTPCRSSSGASDRSAPAPPWTMIVGTRVAGTRPVDDGIALTVSQSTRIARATRPSERPHHPLPTLSPPRRAPQGGGGAAAPPLRRAALLGEAATGIRRPTRATPPRRPGAGRPRRQPHREDVHRRPQRRLVVRRAPPRLVREPAHVDARRGRPRAERRVHHRGDPVRAPRQQADAHGDRGVRALSAARAAPPLAGPRGGRARAHRLAGLLERAARPR